jgi:glycosyltransferase involved in cell wall biosynthesis
MDKNIVWLYPKLEKWMGGTKYVFECTKRLAKKFPLKVIAQKSSEDVVAKFREEKIDVHILNSRSFTDLSFWLAFNRITHHDVELISRHVNSETVMISSMYPLNYMAAQFPNKHIQIVYEPFSFFYRDDLYKDFGITTDLFFRVIRKWYSSTDKGATQKAHVVLTLSEFERRNIKNIYGVDSNVVYEGVDCSVFYPRDTANLRVKYAGQIPLMHSTGFDTYKGTDLVFEALPLLKVKMPNFKLLVTYTRENKRKLNEYTQFIKQHGLEDNVEFLQFVPLEELPSYYSFASVYLEPGKGRSMSLSNKEAMACGTPVIRGNDSSEEVRDGYNGYLVSPDSQEDLVQAIVKIALNDELRATMSRHAVSFVKEKFNWDNVVSRIVSYL